MQQPFPTAFNEINKLTRTVDQEVGGSSPPSCTKEINELVQVDRLRSQRDCDGWRLCYPTEIVAELETRDFHAALLNQ